MRLALFTSFFALVLFSNHTYSQTTPSNTLETIKKRGYLRCGVNTGLTGFSIKDQQGRWSGFDVEFCRSLSAAIFQNPDKVEYIGLLANERFTALKYEKIDVLYRNSTVTATRDTSLGIRFAGVNYYDGQGFLVHKDKKIGSAYQLNKITFCMVEGTSSLKNLEDFIAANQLKENTTILKFRSTEEVTSNIESGFCNALSSDQSQLYAQRATLKNPEHYLILPEIISKEPLGPAVKAGDETWRSVVQWTLNAMIEAEFLGIDSKNIQQLSRSEEYHHTSQLLEKGNNAGASLGLERDWIVHIISQVGNYGEVFEKTIGSHSKLGIARGLNAQWNEGGILYSKPF